MREANRINRIKQAVEWPVLIAAMTGVLLLGTVGCADEALTGPEAAVFVDNATAEQEQDAGQNANERQRDKNARNNGQAFHQ